MPTGEIEVVASELLLLNEAKTPPFSPAEDAIANEEVRLKYRYLDLRRTEMQHELRPAQPRRHGHPQLPRRRRLPRDRNAVHDPLHARRRARLPRAQPRPSRQLLRAAAVAADLQADPHDLRLRPLLPDRPLLPRRGPARRPPARVHPDRPRDELPAAGHRLPRRRGLPHRGVRGRRHRAAHALRRA